MCSEGKATVILAAGSIAIEMLPIPPSEFLMGSGNHWFQETPAHKVNIRSGFLLGKYPVSQKQWHMVMGDNPSEFSSSIVSVRAGTS